MEVFVARQPIFNKNQEVYGYELLYRLGTSNFYEGTDGDRATSEVIANSFLLIGIEALTGGKRAFINFTRNLLTNETATILPRDLVAVEVLENISPDDEIINVCRKLKQAGYMLVLDDFVFKPEIKPLIELADIVKVDFLSSSSEERMDLIRRFRSGKIKFLAEKVETREAFNEALEMGYTFFQGYFFSKPVILSGQDVPGYKINYLQVLQEVNRVELDFDHIERIIKRDVSLSYKLLKYINSAAYGFRTRISSIKHALVLLGAQEVKKWVTLIALRGMGEDKPDEIMTSSIIRARFGELMAPMVGLTDRAADIFLMGMFSMIDALIDRPLSSIVDELPISEEIKGALMGEQCRYREVLELLLAYEKGDWENFTRYSSGFRLDHGMVPDLYIQSLEWANKVIDS